MDVTKAVEVVIAEVLTNAPEHIKFPCNFDLRLFRNSPTAGRAIGTNRLEINADLAEKYPDGLRDTVIHEMAHCLVHLNYDRRCKPHGQEWQNMMYKLGVEPQRCHRMEQPDLVRKRHSTHHYRCGCGDHHLKTGRHNKHIVYGVTFTCRKCGTDLEYQGNG